MQKGVSGIPICVNRYRSPNSIPPKNSPTIIVPEINYAGATLTSTEKRNDESISIGERAVMKMEAYCVKCKAKREMQNPVSMTMKNGKPATQGVCPACGTKMFRIGKG